MADNIITVESYEQIATMLTKLATNYSNLASIFYDVFYNPSPAEVTFQMYDEQGVLQTYTIPNRAKDLENLLSGEGSPEGSVEGTLGVLYQDLSNGDVYIKETSEGSEGWSQLTTEVFLKSIFIQGNGSPEGNVSASKGVLYIDTNNASLYIKTTITGTTGWQMISATLGAFADIDVSNLSTEGNSKFANSDLTNLTPLGEIHFANPSLTNLNETGELKFASKEDISNKVINISNLSTNVEYPSAKAVYNYTGSRVTVMSSSSTDSQYPSAKCVYDALSNVKGYIDRNRTLNLTGDVTGSASFNLASSSF